MKKVFLFFFALVFSGSLFAAKIDEIVFFGDSLTDNGNIYDMLKIIPRSPPYYEGRFSNGPAWGDYLSQHLQSTWGIAASNYAYGGATAFQHDSGLFMFAMTLENELDIYNTYAAIKNIDYSKKLFVVWIGANDYLWEEDLDTEALTSQVLDKINWGITNLIDHGAQNFLVLNLPDLAATPYAEAHSLQERMHTLATVHNQKLTKLLSDLRTAHPQAKFFTVDIYDTFNDLTAHTDKFNQKYQTHLSNINEACLLNGIMLKKDGNLEKSLLPVAEKMAQKYNAHALATGILHSPSLKEVYLAGGVKDEVSDKEMCDYPDQYIFWDRIHPTTVVHQILSSIVTEKLESEAKDLLVG